MAMAIRGSKNYYHLAKIQHRHFIAQGKSIGFTEKEVLELINSVVQETDNVILQVTTMLPRDFSTELADKIFNGMKIQAQKLNVNSILGV